MNRILNSLSSFDLCLQNIAPHRHRWLMLLPVALAALLWPWQITDYPNHSGDSAQFQFVAPMLGVPHPPGAPLYVYALWLLGKALPFATPALVANIFAILCGIGLLAAFTQLMCRWGLSPVAVMAGTMMVLASPRFGRLATVAEVYVPALLFLLLAMERVEAWKVSGRRTQLLTGALLAAISTGIYSGSIIMVPLLLLQLGMAQRPFFRTVAGWISILLFVLVVAGAYLSQIPRLLDPQTPFRWRLIEDMGDVVGYLSAGGFRESFTLSPVQHSLARRFVLYFEKAMKETVWLPVLLATVLVVVRCRRVWRRSDLIPALLLLTNLVFVCVYEVWDVWEFMLPGVVALAMLSARVVDALSEMAGPGEWRPALVRVTVALVLLTSVVHLMVTQDDVREKVRNPIRTEAALRYLDVAGENSVIFSPRWDDSAFIWYHLFQPEGARLGILLAHGEIDGSIVEYVLHDREFALADVGVTVNSGRRVYAIGLDTSERLASAGLIVRKVSKDMFRVEKP